jgi:hypothetical protein
MSVSLEESPSNHAKRDLVGEDVNPQNRPAAGFFLMRQTLLTAHSIVGLK